MPGLSMVFISPGDSKTWTSNGVGNYTAGPYSTALTLDPESYDTIDTNPATAAPFPARRNKPPPNLRKFSAGSARVGYTELERAHPSHGALRSQPVRLDARHAFDGILERACVRVVAGAEVLSSSISDGMPVLHVASEWQEMSNWGNTGNLATAPAPAACAPVQVVTDC